MRVFRLFSGLLLLLGLVCNLPSGFKIAKGRKHAMLLLSNVATESQQFFSSCEQSSNEDICSFAMDGDTSPEWFQCSTTNVESGVKPWWRGYLENPVYVATVTVHNTNWKKIGATDGLTDFILSGSGYICYTHVDPVSFGSIIFPCDILASDIEIKSNIESAILALSEVIVMGSPLTFPTVLSGPGLPVKYEGCSQSTTRESYFCWNAIDKRAGTKDVRECSVTEPKPYQWWHAVFQVPLIVQQVIIHIPDCCKKSMTNFEITVGGRRCGRYDNPMTFSIKRFICNHFGGNVKIQLMGADPISLSICEVEVFGHPVDMLPEHKRSYVGCFIDTNTDPTLGVESKEPVSITHVHTGKCDRMCRRYKAKYFGLRAGGECWCAGSMGEYAKANDAECNGMQCEGQKNEPCGNVNRTLVFELL